MPSLPGGLEWGKEGLKVLRVFLGTDNLQAKNWEESVWQGSWTDNGEYSFPSLLITPAVCVGGRGLQEGGDQLLSFRTPHLDKFKDAGRKAIYQVCVKVLNLQSLARLKGLR